MSRDKERNRLYVKRGAQRYPGLPGQLLPAPLLHRRNPAIFGLETGDPWPMYRAQAKKLDRQPCAGDNIMKMTLAP